MPWDELEITLYKIHEVPVSNNEKAVGVVEKNEGVLLRNWLTFVLRQAVADAERECYYAPRDSLHTRRRTMKITRGNFAWHKSM